MVDFLRALAQAHLMTRYKNLTDVITLSQAYCATLSLEYLTTVGTMAELEEGFVVYVVERGSPAQIAQVSW